MSTNTEATIQNPKFTTLKQSAAFSHLEIIYARLKPEHFLQCQVILYRLALRAVTDPHRPLGDPEIQEIAESVEETCSMIESMREMFSDEIN